MKVYYETQNLQSHMSFEKLPEVFEEIHLR